MIILNSDCSVINATPEEIIKVLKNVRLKIHGLIEPNYGWNLIGFKSYIFQETQQNLIDAQSYEIGSDWFEKVDLWSVDEIEGKF